MVTAVRKICVPSAGQLVGVQGGSEGRDARRRRSRAARGGTGSRPARGVKNFFDPNNSDIAFSIGRNDYTWSVVISAVVVALFVALVVIGGIKRIANVTKVVVPFMIIIYIIS